ncbi:MAG: hypothetical protein OXG65_14200 [Chloroflexi bacterium]|nr:hypothetical protein [Chloroflexota bacterium]
MDAARGAAARRPTALKRQTSLVVPAVVTQGFHRFVDLRFVDAGRVRWLGVDVCPLARC